MGTDRPDVIITTVLARRFGIIAIRSSTMRIGGSRPSPTLEGLTFAPISTAISQKGFM